MGLCLPVWIICWPFILIAFIVLPLLLIYFLSEFIRMKQKKHKTWTIITAMAIIVLIVFTVYWTTLISTPCGGGCELEGLEIRPDDGYVVLNLYYEAGLNNSTISKFDNDTLSLKMTVLNDDTSFYYHYSISDLNATLNVGKGGDGLLIQYPKMNYPYNILFEFVINSTHPDVRNATILGPTNYLNFTVKAMRGYSLNVTFSDEYAGYYDLLEYSRGNTSAVMHLFEPRYIPEARYRVYGHPFEIRTRVVCWD